MGKNKINTKSQQIFQEDEQQSQQTQQIGQMTFRMDYINLKKNKPKPLLPNEQNDHVVQLFRNEQLNKYLEQLENEKQQAKQKKKNPIKDPKSLQGLKSQIFAQLQFNLKIHTNVCLLGGMDKMQIMDDVVEFLQKNDEYVFVIRGYSQPINQKKIYNSFGTFLMNCHFTGNINQIVLKEQLKEYQAILKSTPEDTIIYVVFYDLSNFSLLNAETQVKIASLLALPRIRVIASIESMKILLYLSFKSIALYNFAYINCNSTCIPITKVLKYMPILNQRAQKTQLQIMQIWKSLNRNQRQIAIILAQNQLNNLSTGQQNYLSFTELLQSCIDKIILSDDHQLRQNLIQLTDHKVIIQDIDKAKNKKVYIMKLDRRILESMIDGKYDNYDNYENNEEKDK